MQEKDNILYTNKDLRQLNLSGNIHFIYDEGTIISDASTKMVPDDTTHLLLDAVIKLDKVQLNRLSKLEYIGTTYTGWWDKYFDVDEIKKRDITLQINTGYATNAVAEAVFTVLLINSRGKLSSNDSKPNYELMNKKMLILGNGRIGKRINEIANGFKLKTFFFDSRKESSNTIDRETDILSVNVPKSAGKVLDKNILAKLESLKVIVNSSGWENVEVNDLYEYLETHKNCLYIHIAYPQKEIEEQFIKLSNLVFYPLFSNSTDESIIERKEAPVRALKVFLESADYA